MLSAVHIENYHRDRYLIQPVLLSDAEVKKLYAIAIKDDAMFSHGFDLNDSNGKKTRLSLWYTRGDDAYGLLTRSRRLVAAADQLMDKGGSVCHFHSKLMQKEPRVGGAWEWHQDYGCYNRSSNVPFNEPSGKSTIPIDVVEDDALLTKDALALGDGAGFLEKEKDEALK